MDKLYKKEINWAGKKLTLETGKVARQADSAVMASMGETVVLCKMTTVVIIEFPKLYLYTK